MTHHRWADVPREQLNPQLARQVIHGAKMTVARLYLAKNAVVPRHSHANEQITLLQEGRLRFVFDDGEATVEPGEIMQIPPDKPHSVVALEDSVALDLFAPVREDWVRGDDAYLRK